MDHHDELDQQLWEFVYGLLSEQDGESMRGRIRSEPGVARAYVRVKQRSELVAQAARAEAPTIALPRPAAHTAAGDSSARWAFSASAGPWLMRAAHGLTALAATALICVMGYGLLRSREAPQSSAVQPDEPILAQVSVPDALRPDTQNWFFVQTTRPDGTPRSGPVYYRFYDERRDLRLNGQFNTNAEGWGQFALSPTSARSVNWLEVATGQPVSTIGAPLTRSSADQLAYLTLDKKTFVPGNTVHFRAVVLAELELIPDQDVTAEFDVLDPNGRSLLPAPQRVRTQRGIAGGSYTLATDIESGQYNITLRNPEGKFAASHRSFTVQSRRALSVDMQVARQRSDSAAAVVSQLQVYRANGQPAAGARLEANAVVGGNELPEAAALTADERGLAKIRLALPVTLSDAKGTLNVRVQDGEREARLSRELPPPTPDVVVNFVPEGGTLVPGIDNRCYFAGSDALQQPLDLMGRVVDSDGREVAQAQSLRAGQGVFEFTPETEKNYTLAIDQPPNVAVRPDLPPVSDVEGTSLRIDPAIVDAEATLAVQLGVTRADACVLVAAYCRGAMVGQQLIDKSRFTRMGNAYASRFDLSLAEEASGAIRVAAFDCAQRSSSAVAERLAFRYPRQRLQLRVEELPAADVSAGISRLRITVTDEAARPIPAVLSVGIVGDELLADEQSGPAMAAHYYLANELDRPEEIGDGLEYLATDADARTALELLLGTQRQPRFSAPSGESVLLAESAGRPDKESAESYGALPANSPSAGYYLQDGAVREPLSSAQAAGAPTVYDNRAELDRQLAIPASSPLAPSLDRKRLGQILLLGGAMLALAAVMLALLRLAERAAYLLPVFATAGASLLIGLMWLRIDQGELGRVAQALPAAKEEQVVPRESVDEPTAADSMLSFAKKLKQLEDAPLAEEARPSSESAMEVRAPSPAFGEDIAYGEPPQISPAPAPMAVAPARKPESVSRGRAEPLLAQDFADSLRTEEVRDDGSQIAGRAKLMRRSGERFMVGPGAGTELSAGVESQAAAPLESAAQPDQPMAGMGNAPRMMSGGYGGAAPAPPPPAATAPAASAYAMESVTGRSLAPAAPPARGMLTRGETETPQLAKELEWESVSEDPGATVYWNPLLVADENGQITIDVARGRTRNLRIVIDAHAAGRLGSLATTIPVRDLP